MPQKHEIRMDVTQYSDGETLVERPSSIVFQDMEEHIKELEGILRYWHSTMERLYPYTWHHYPEMIEIQRRLQHLGLCGQGEIRYGQTEPISKVDTQKNRHQS